MQTESADGMGSGGLANETPTATAKTNLLARCVSRFAQCLTIMGMDTRKRGRPKIATLLLMSAQVPFLRD